MNIKAIIFDMDGTLVNSMQSVYSILNLIMKELNLPKINTKQMDKIAGRRLGDILPKLTPQVKDSDILKDEDRFWQLYEESNHLLFPGVKRTLQQLSKKNILLGIFTTTPRKITQVLLTKLQIIDFFSVIIAREDVNHPKPHPEGVMIAIKKLNVHPQKCILVGDSPADIKSGKAAGITTIGVLTAFSSKTSLKNAGANFIIHNIEEIQKIIQKQSY